MKPDPPIGPINNMRQIDLNLRAQFILVFGQAGDDPDLWPHYECAIKQTNVLMTVRDTPYDEQRLRHVIESIGLQITGRMALLHPPSLTRAGYSNHTMRGRWCTWKLERSAY